MKRWSLVFLAACAAQPKPVPKTAVPPPPVATATVAPPVTPSPPVAVEAPIPKLVAKPFIVDGKGFTSVWEIEGATILVRENVVGYLEPGDKVEWIAKIPKQALSGRAHIYDVRGRYLDAIDVFFQGEGRATFPTYLPLTGKGLKVSGGTGSVADQVFTARIGETALAIAASQADKYELVTTRGPSLTRTVQRATVCKPGELTDMVWQHWNPAESPAIPLIGLESTANGTLVAVGRRCGHGMAAEIWEPGKTTSHIVDLGAMWTKEDYFSTLFRGAASDELWIVSDRIDGGLLHFKDGVFALAPHLDAIAEAFPSKSGELHVRTKDGMIYRLEGGHYRPVAQTEAKQHFGRMTMDASGAFWLTNGETAYRLEPATP